MKYSLRFAIATLFFISMLGGCRESNAEDVKGSIKFAENPDGGGLTCSLPFMNRKVDFEDNAYGCTDDDYSYFKLDNAPSAATIHLNSENTCTTEGSTHNEWWFDLKTIKHPTTTGWISILSLKAEQPGSIVTAGLVLVKKHYNFGDIDAELECVHLTVSPLP